MERERCQQQRSPFKGPQLLQRGILGQEAWILFLYAILGTGRYEMKITVKKSFSNAVSDLTPF